MTVKELRELLYRCQDEFEIMVDGDGEIGDIVEQHGITDESDNKLIIWVK